MKKEQMKCKRCAKPAAEGKKSCEYHLAKDREMYYRKKQSDPEWWEKKKAQIRRTRKERYANDEKYRKRYRAYRNKQYKNLTDEQRQALREKARGYWQRRVAVDSEWHQHKLKQQRSYWRKKVKSDPEWYEQKKAKVREWRANLTDERRAELNEYRKNYRREQMKDPAYRTRYRQRANAYNKEYRRRIWYPASEEAKKRVEKMRKEQYKLQQRYKKTRQQIDVLKEQQDNKCPLCKLSLPEDNNSIHVDHICPVSKGGSDDPDNLQAVHSLCNLLKGNRDGLNDYQMEYVKEALK